MPKLLSLPKLSNKDAHTTLRLSNKLSSRRLRPSKSKKLKLRLNKSKLRPNRDNAQSLDIPLPKLSKDNAQSPDKPSPKPRLKEDNAQSLDKLKPNRHNAQSPDKPRPSREDAQSAQRSNNKADAQLSPPDAQSWPPGALISKPEDPQWTLRTQSSPPSVDTSFNNAQDWEK